MMFSDLDTVKPIYRTTSLLHRESPESFLNISENYASTSMNEGSNILVVIDAQVEESENLRRGVIPGAKVILLNAWEDGVRQITQALQENPEISELHLISHGRPGSLQLGNTQLSLDTLQHYASELCNWPVSRLILYGCNVATGDAGTEFIEKLHQLTQAEIAASTTRTGDAALGGDWKLDVKTSDFDVVLALSKETQANYRSVFTSASDLTVDGVPVAGGEGDRTETGLEEDGTTSVTINFGQGDNLLLEGFNLGGDTFETSGDALENFVLRRVANDEVGTNDDGEVIRRQIVWFETFGGNTQGGVLNLSPGFPAEEEQTLMEEALTGNIINRGTDNVFSNTGNSEGNNNNIERIDYFSQGSLAIAAGADASDFGFLILERGGNDPLSIAAITGLDDTGNPSAYGELIQFTDPPNDWGQSTISLNTEVLQRPDAGQGQLQNTADTDGVVSGIFVSYNDLGITPGQEFFGYSLFPADIDQDNDLVNLTDFPTDTPDDGANNGGLDLIAGGVVFARQGVNIRPTAVPDAVEISFGTPSIDISVLVDNGSGVDTDQDNGPNPIAIVPESITTPANGTVVLNNDGTITYTPNNPDSPEPDTFDYAITDGEDQSDLATVTINVTAPPTTVSGTVFTDTDLSNVLDPGEQGIANITVRLRDGNDQQIAQTVTNDNGEYTFENVAAGDYNVRVVPNDEDLGGAQLGTQNNIDINVGQEPVTDINFGFDPVVTTGQAVTGTVFLDNDGNDADSGEPGIPNITVQLLDASQTVVATATTDDQGNYQFPDIADGSYTIQVDTADTDLNGATIGTPNDTVINVAGAPVGDIDFGFDPGTPPTGQPVTGTVFFDDNRDDADSGEPGIPNITVQLLDASQTVVATATTDDQGNYQFPDIADGDYTVQVDTADTDLNGAIIGTPNDTVINVAGAPVGDIDFGFDRDEIPATTTVSGTVFIDTNTSDELDPGEEGIPDITVRLLDSEGNPIPEFPNDSTDADGNYAFENVPNGNYIVQVAFRDPQRPTGSELGTPNNIEIVVAGAPVADIDFGFDPGTPPTGQAVTGTVFLDNDGDDAESDEEPGIANITVRLLDANQAEVATATTDADGNYQFANVDDGEYTVQVDTTDTDLNGATLGTPNDPTITVAGAPVADIDFGFDPGTPPTGQSVTGTVFADANGDNLGSGEPGIAEITVRLLDANQAEVATTTTDAEGNYQFANVDDGEYTVQVDTTDTDLNGAALGTDNDLPITVAGTPITDQNFGFDVPPVAVPDAITTPPDTNAVLNVLTNDTDDGTLNPATVDLDPTTPERETTVAVPGEGTYSVDDTGVVTFDPDPNFTGTSTINYTVQDNLGLPSDPAAITVTVESGPTNPDAVDDTRSIRSNTSVTINILENDSDPENDPLTIDSFDTPSANGGTVALSPSERALVYTPATDFRGEDTFVYTISDGNGGIDTATVTINVNDQAPNAIDDVGSTPSNTPININVLANDTDPENDPLIIEIFDPISVNSGTVEFSPDGQTLIYTPPENFVGVDTFTYTVNDGNDAIDTATVTINVSDQAPDAVDDAQTTTRDIPTTINVLENDTDPDNNLLTIQDFDETSPNGGTIMLSPDGNGLVYTPPAGFTGTDTFTYIVTDGIETDTATVTVTVDPPAITNPDAVDDADETLPFVPVTIDVLANDTDPENDPLSIDSFDPVSANGTIALSEDGQELVYTPNDGFLGTDTFNYTISDGNGGTDTATVTVDVVNQPPVATDENLLTSLNTTVEFNLVDGNVTDPDGNDTVNLSTIDLNPTTPDIESEFVIPDGGTFSVNPEGQGNFTPADGFVGTVEIPYTVRDDFGAISNVANISVTVSAPPVATDENLNTELNTPVDFNLTDNVSDPDGTVNLGSIDLDPATPEIERQFVVPDQGTFSIDPEGQGTFDPVDGFTGTVAIPYTVEDDEGLTSNPANISVTVNPDSNQPPVAENVQNNSIFNNSAPLPLNLTTEDFSDPDGVVESINFTLPNAGQGTLFFEGTAVSDPAQVQGLSPDQIEDLTFQPNSGFAGIAAIPYTVTDDDAAASNVANITFPVNAVVIQIPGVPGPTPEPENEPPVAANETGDIINDGDPSTVPPLTATDFDGTVEFFTITELPPNGTLFLDDEEITDLDQVQQLTPEQAGQLTFEPDPDFTGDVTFSYTATDDDGAVSNTAEVRLTIQEGTAIPRVDPIDDGGCDCPPLPDFEGLVLPERPDLIPAASVVGEITGSDADDVIPGSVEDDVITAFNGNDVTVGFEGGDSIFGGVGNELIFGDEGDDFMFGDQGADTLIGSNDDPNISAVAVANENDTMFGNQSNDVMQGGPGEDLMFNGKDDDFAFGGQQNDFIYGDQGNDTIYGDDGNDTLIGDTADENVIEAERGLNGMIDFMWGGSGDDFMNGGRSNDTLSGGVGNDTVNGGKEDDLIYGEAGDDLLLGDLGNDHICGDEGNDTIYGSINDNTTSITTPERDTLCGGSGNDILSGNEDQDKLCGGEDNDTLHGGLGDDELAGEEGDDWLFGDQGDDLISGGTGADRFVQFSDSGTDTIRDFQLGIDLIALGGGLSFNDLSVSQDGTSTVVSLNSQQLLILEDIQATTLTEDSFTSF